MIRARQWLSVALVLIAASAAVAVIWFTLGPKGADPSTTVPKTVHTLAPSAPPEPATPSTSTVSALPSSVPIRITIPAIKVNAPIMPVGLVNGSVGTPPLSNHNLAGWFTGTVTPGQQGPSLIDGHVDSVTGPSVFYSLKYLHNGDAVTVYRADGRTVTFHVTWVQVTAKVAFPWNEVLKGTPGPELRLVTCGGAFNYNTGHYVDNIIVYAN